MNKLIALAFAIAVSTSNIFGQGTVNWLSITPAAFTAQTNTTQISPYFGGYSTGGGAQGAMGTSANGSLFYMTILYLSSGGTQAAVPGTIGQFGTWQDTGLMATNSSVVTGRFTPMSPNSAATVPWSYGVTNSVIAVVWSENLGTTWSSAFNKLNNWMAFGGTVSGLAFFGASATGFFTPNTDGTNPGGILIHSAASNVNGVPINSLNTQLYIVPIPEPQTWALLLTGLAGLGIRRWHSNRAKSK